MRDLSFIERGNVFVEWDMCWINHALSRREVPDASYGILGILVSSTTEVSESNFQYIHNMEHQRDRARVKIKCAVKRRTVMTFLAAIIAISYLACSTNRPSPTVSGIHQKARANPALS